MASFQLCEDEIIYTCRAGYKRVIDNSASVSVDRTWYWRLSLMVRSPSTPCYKCGRLDRWGLPLKNWQPTTHCSRDSECLMHSSRKWPLHVFSLHTRSYTKTQPRTHFTKILTLRLPCKCILMMMSGIYVNLLQVFSCIRDADVPISVNECIIAFNIFSVYHLRW